MTTILVTFIVGFMFSWALTPVARWMGTSLGAMDAPSARKVHTRPIPRSGGLAIVLSFFLAIAVCTLLGTKISGLLVWNDQRIFAVFGGLLIFAVGLFDDFRRLGAKIKLAFQILAATLAFYGGVRIEGFFVGGMGIHFGIMSWAITVFWFLLLINAMNLIDGLDGLAAGVGFFAGIVMMVSTMIQAHYMATLEFAALAGVLLGFLRYNFNPASIFLGDGGSYFIGYTIAALSILGSLKSQVGATLLIPLLALGVPIFDTILSPLRRFILGRQMFQPDKGHIHHRLIMMGLSSSRAVLIIYGASGLLCMAAILIVNLRNEMVGMFLIALGAGSIVVVRKLGYLEYLTTDKLFGWLRDISDEVGITKGRRTFLDLQIELGSARNMEELWQNICLALEIMHFDRGELYILSHHGAVKEPELTRVWGQPPYQHKDYVFDDSMMRIGIPLIVGNKTMYRLVLIKNLNTEPIQPHTLRRLEHLRRSVMGAMNNIYPAPAPTLIRDSPLFMRLLRRFSFSR